MRIPSLALCLLMLAPMARADDFPNDFYALSSDLCAKSLTGEFQEFDASDFRSTIDMASYGIAPFCDCVAKRYLAEGDRELFRDMKSEIIANESYFTISFTMFDHMSNCLPAAETAGLGIDLGLSAEDLSRDLVFADDSDDVIDGDLVDLDFPADESDIFMCRSAFAGDMAFPSFDAAAQTARIAANGRSLDDVCTCAARGISAEGQPLQDAIANAQNPGVVYGSALVGAIEICI